jgi:PAS domain S-box-containing protein
MGHGHPAESDLSAAAGPPGEQATPCGAEYRELLSLYSNDIVLLFDDQFRILDCNERALEAYGYGRDGLLALTLDDLRAAESPVALEDRKASVRRCGNAIFESIHRRRDGSTFPVETSVRVVETEGGSYYHATVRDISERTAAGDALRGTRSLLEALVEGTSDTVYVKDAEGRYLLFNAAAE